MNNAAQMRDVTVATVTPILNGVNGTATAILGVVKTVSLQLRRVYDDTTESSATAPSSRTLRWGGGSVRIAGMSQTTGSKLAALFAGGGKATLLLTEASSGDAYQLACRNEELGKEMGEQKTMDTLTLTVEGTPQFGAAGASVTTIPLD